MIEFKTIRDGFMIMMKFGVRHAFNRYKDLMMVKEEDKRKTRLYNKLKPQGIIIKNIGGSQMQLDMNDYGIHRDLFLDGIREPSATEHLIKILDKNDIVLEIGANIGYYVLLESRLCKKVYAVEPILKNINNLKTNIGLNQRQNVEVFQMAMSDSKGKKAMYISSRSNLHSFRTINNPIKKIFIDVDTVDNFLKNKESPTFVRMDVEGYELNVLNGMMKTLKKIDRMFIEVHADIMKLEETQKFISILRDERFRPELIIKYDKPGLSRILPNDYINKVYVGDKGVYEIFFKKYL